MGTLVFNKEHASPPEQAIVYKEGKRIGAVRLTEKNELIFRVDPDAPSRSVSKVPPVIGCTILSNVLRGGC
jgi:hypothetical protein